MTTKCYICGSKLTNDEIQQNKKNPDIIKARNETLNTIKEYKEWQDDPFTLKRWEVSQLEEERELGKSMSDFTRQLFDYTASILHLMIPCTFCCKNFSGPHTIIKFFPDEFVRATKELTKDRRKKIWEHWAKGKELTSWEKMKLRIIWRV